MNLKRLFLIAGLFGAGLLILSACSPAGAKTAEEQLDDNHEHMDHMAHMHVDPPEEFSDLTNPFGDEDEAIEAGKETFATICSTCHGPEGKGDGPAGEALEPKPANLADGMMIGELSDGYLYWRISKGGAMDPFNSAMPTWESTLSENERWQLVSYIRTLSDGAANHMEMGGEHHMEDEHNKE